MNMQNLIDLLNDDLKREYSHWHFYMQASTNVVGINHEELSEFFLEQAAGEMKHIEQFRRLINGLGGKPTNAVAFFNEELTSASGLLKEALNMEDDAVDNYVRQIKMLQHMQESSIKSDQVDGKYVEIFLEDQIKDSREDADKIRQMLRN